MATETSTGRKNIAWNQESFAEGLSFAKFVLNVDEVYPDQEKAIRGFFRGKDLYFSAPTGYGKSFVFQAIPLVADYLLDQNPFSSCILVVSPLQSLMLDQVMKLNALGLKAAAIYADQTEEVLNSILKDDEYGGDFTYIFTSPESMLASEKWRTFLMSTCFQKRCVAVAFDEAHCIAQWGLTATQGTPFRKWFGLVGEFRALLGSCVKIAVFTATASKSTKASIFNALNLRMFSTFIVEKSPVKPNIVFHCKYIGNDTKLQVIFSEVIDEVKNYGVDTKRTIMFCQTRNQCALIWKMFEIVLADKFYNGDSCIPTARLIEMFHAGTPASVKDHILKEINKEDSHLRIIIVTVAFGMGVDCKNVHRIIHFGPAKTVESYLQECGRAGRDSKQSHCYLLYNGFLTSHCQSEMKQYVVADGCRRKFLQDSFPGPHGAVAPGDCCDVCLKNCSCPSLVQKKCGTLEFNRPSNKAQICERKRSVSQEEKDNLKVKLTEYKNTHRQSIPHVSVSFPSICLEFTDFHIWQVLRHCDHLFTLDDVFAVVEIWRMKHAVKILLAVSDVFGDLPPDELHEARNLATEDAEDELEDTWLAVRDDSEIDILDDTDQLQDMAAGMEALDKSGPINQSLSDILNYENIKPTIDEEVEPMEM
eukprot:gene9805-18368_t